jgi:hypothetical protein
MQVHLQSYSMEVTDINLDVVLRLIRDPYRRRLLLELAESNPLNVTTLAAEMAINTDERTDLQTRLYHNHLPMLDDTRVIEWERDSDVVIRGSAFGEVRLLLELIDEQRDTLPDHWV